MSFYRNKRVVVTGAMGFVGSNLCLRLAEEGARVTGIDAMIAGCGGNGFNLEGARGAIEVVTRDIGDRRVAGDVKRADVVFNLAGEVSHIHSMLYPQRDARINVTAQMEFLNTLAAVRPGVRVVYASTRQIYGAVQTLPADETVAPSAVDFNGVHKFAAGQYHQLLTRLGRLDAVILRLTNVYGPRMAIGLGCQGFLPVFTGCAVMGTPLEVFGDGQQLRDPLYVDDACEAFLRAGEVERPRQRCFNIGTGHGDSVMEIARVFAEEAGLGEPRLRAFPEDRKPIDIGSYCTGPGAADAELGWRPEVGLRKGVRRTLAYHKRYRSEYLRDALRCSLGHQNRSARAS